VNAQAKKQELHFRQSNVQDELKYSLMHSTERRCVETVDEDENLKSSDLVAHAFQED
jgi:hypothetical protein